MGDIAQFTGGKVPQKLAARQADNSDLSSGVRGGYSVVSIRGSRWHVKVGDEETTIIDPETKDPVGSLRLVLLKSSPNVSKNYYKGGWEEGSSDPPVCWSIDGKVPDPGAPDKQSPSCAACPMNQFGSRVTEAGKKVKACGDSRRIAVVPEGDLANDVYGGPMLLRVPASSLSNLSQFGKKMSNKGFPYNTIVTRVSFDHTVSFPKLEFNATRPLTDDEADTIIGLLNTPEFSDKIESVLAKDLEVVPQPAAEEKPLFEDAPEVQPKAAAKAPAKAAAVRTAAPPVAEKAAEETVEVDESDDQLDSELESILGSLDNLD